MMEPICTCTDDAYCPECFERRKERERQRKFAKAVIESQRSFIQAFLRWASGEEQDANTSRSLR